MEVEVAMRCAVCVEAVEWVAYGECGHVDVCALCIARLRFVCADRRCCICKSLSPTLFVTRALGSRTRVINDFSVLPAHVKDGKLGSYWFHEGTQTYFDNFDAYKIVKDMCRLSCTVCEKLSEAEGKRASKRTSKIKNIEQLKEHLSRRHELFFCSLCLANKKVFMCEQKLYSRVQLRQHIRSGDSEVDGSKSERCGFSGHPYCEFCQTPFYGDNELYFHLSTEHYTCHICQRERPAEYEYHKDYNDLEIHFRQGHFLCEDVECLDKKFIVFDSEADLKKHAVLEHGGNVTCYKCNGALQDREEEGYSIRARTCDPHVSSSRISSATSSYAEGTPSNVIHGHTGTYHMSFNAHSTPSLGHQGTALDFRSVLLNGPSFPPLPSLSKRRRHKSKKNPQAGQTALDLLQNPPLLSSASSHSLLSSNASNGPHSGPTVSPQSGPLKVGDYPSSSCMSPLNSPSSEACFASSDSISSYGINQVDSSSCAYDFVDGGSQPLSVCSGHSSNKDDVQAANKSLVDSIHAALEFSVDKFAAFKKISKDYREGKIEAGEYISYVRLFGLEHLILDLARLCPDQQKQKELMETFRSELGCFKETGLPSESGSKSRKKGKEKCEDSETSKRDMSADGLVNHMKELKVTAQPLKEPSSSNGVANTKMLQISDSDSNGEVKGRTSAVTEAPLILAGDSVSKDYISSSKGGSLNSGPITVATAGKKKLKKSPNLLKSCVSEKPANLRIKDLTSDLMVVRPNQDSILASVRGVWRNYGGRRVVTITEASPCSR